MTPEFASPEQVRGAPITTSSDVYQLGLLLYLLLCGHHPHRTTERCSAALERVICDRDPIPPSATVTGRLEAGTGPTPNEVGQARSVTPLRLRRLLGGDLDTITLKALRKEPERRYESAERLGEDIDRYLAGQPVTARRDTLAYRTKKFVLRHRLGVAFSSGLVAFTVLAAWRLADERNQARAAAANFEQIAAFTTELLQVSDPGRTKGYEISAEELLRWGTRRVASERETNPEVRSVIMTTLGDIYRRRGMYPESRPLLEEGLALREARFGPDGLEVATSLNALADLGTVQGRYDEAERQYLRALTTREQLLGPDHLETATTLEGLGNLYSRRNRFDQATAMFTRALAIRIRTHGWYNPDVAQSLGSLAVMSRENGHCDRARRQLERALAITERTLGPDHPQVAVILTNYGSVARIQGNLDAAEAAYRRALAIREKRLGPRHPDVISALNNLADCCLWVGKLREADAILARAYETVSLVLPKDHPSAATVLNNICALRLNQGRPAAARPYCDRAMSIRTRVFGPTNRTIAWSLRNLSRLRVLDGCPAEAVDMQQRMLEVYQAIGLNADSLGAMYELGATLNKLGRYDEAEAILQQSLAMATWSCASHGDDCLALGLHKAKVYLVLGLVQRARGNEASARTWWLQGMDEIEQRPYPPLVETLDIHARLLLLLGRQDEARSLISRLGAMGWSNPDLAKLIGAQFRDNTGFRSHTGRGDPSRPSPASSPLHTLPIQ
jgi:tetratricopeptide (TPR) repeat protein